LNRIAYIDESGSLPDPAQPFIVVAALIVAETDVSRLRAVLPRIRKRLNQRRKRGRHVTAEFKFEYLARQGEWETIARVLNAIQKLPCQLVIVQIDKGTKSIKDDSLNYALLLSETVRLCRERDSQIQFVFDRHYLVSQFHKMQSVNHLLARLLGASLDILHEDSQDRSYPGLGLVDFVAGAARFLARADVNQSAYLALKPSMDALATRVVQEKKIAWSELKTYGLELLRK